MILRILIKSVFIFFLLINFFAKANDIASMSNISEAAGSSAQAAADQLASDAGKVAENISGATEALGEAKSDIGVRCFYSTGRKCYDFCYRKFS
jgi:hypothetical protein